MNEEELPTTVIEPTKGLWSLNLDEIWDYRELLYFLTWRDVKVRYKQTVLGFLWAFLQPFLKMVVFSVVFGGMAKLDSEGFPYPIFLYAGLLPWQFFANSLSRSGQSIVSQSNLIKKVYFPRLIVPMSSVGAALVDFGISFLILIGMMFYYQMIPGIQMIMVLPLILITIATALGIGILISALNSAYRDFRYVIPYLIKIWLFLTPVIYSSKIVPSRFRWIISINPMTGIVDAYRSAILGKPFEWESIAISLGVSFVLFVIGLIYFKKVEKYFADIL
ncbi:ABC transporter permease [Candidatus Bipolaricaulota bacterium]|nr:ABC transporter permease [Candidatus Bipolaricaulota bacterium]